MKIIYSYENFYLYFICERGFFLKICLFRQQQTTIIILSSFIDPKQNKKKLIIKIKYNTNDDD